MYTRVVSDDPYVMALRWLARRELSEAQVRERLRRKGVDVEIAEEAVGRLLRERAIDDRRVASAYARTQTVTKGRGRDRVRREIEALGIRADVARAAVDEVFAEVDEGALLEKALDRKWPTTGDVDAADVQRVYRALIRQGFASDATLAAIRVRQKTRR